MPLVPESLTSLGTLKEALNLADTSNDIRLTGVINRVTGWIEDNTHRKLVARNYNGKGTVFDTTKVASEDYLYLDGSRGAWNECGQGELYLPSYPIQRSDTNVVSFKLDCIQNRASTISGGETWDTTSLVEWDAFMVDNDNGIIRFTGSSLLPGFRNYRVTCTAGWLYSTNAPYVPPDLEGLAIELCKQMFRESRTVQSERIGEWSRTYRPNTEDPYLNDVLARYTRILVS